MNIRDCKAIFGSTNVVKYIKKHKRWVGLYEMEIKMNEKRKTDKCTCLMKYSKCNDFDDKMVFSGLTEFG